MASFFLFRSQALWEPWISVPAWPRPRTTPCTTSSENGTETASRNPGHKDMNLSILEEHALSRLPGLPYSPRRSDSRSHGASTTSSINLPTLPTRASGMCSWAHHHRSQALPAKSKSKAQTLIQAVALDPAPAQTPKSSQAPTKTLEQRALSANVRTEGRV